MNFGEDDSFGEQVEKDADLAFMDSDEADLNPNDCEIQETSASNANDNFYFPDDDGEIFFYNSPVKDGGKSNENRANSDEDDAEDEHNISSGLIRDEEADEDAPEEGDGLPLEKTILLDETVEASVLDALDARENAMECTSGEHDWKIPRPLRFSPKSSVLGPLKRTTSSPNTKDGSIPSRMARAGVSPRKAASPAKRNVLKPKTATGRINLTDLSDPLLVPRGKPPVIENEFFGVYCLVSRSENRAYKGRCYIGYTVDPNRRIRQHNAGKQYGGAKKTDNRGPWDMVCIIHGFPNAVSALRFEWAWQNPDKSTRLKEAALKKTRKETPFAFRLRIACQMLNTDPWRQLALTFRWLIPECEIPFPSELPPPPHIGKAYGPVQKTMTLVPVELNEYAVIRDCAICRTRIRELKHLLRCPAFGVCGAHFHARCLAESCLRKQGLLDVQLVPLSGNCPRCAVDYFWGDLVRDQRTLLQIDESKPQFDGVKLADGMIPIKLAQK